MHRRPMEIPDSILVAALRDPGGPLAETVCSALNRYPAVPGLDAYARAWSRLFSPTFQSLLDALKKHP